MECDLPIPREIVAGYDFRSRASTIRFLLTVFACSVGERLSVAKVRDQQHRAKNHCGDLAHTKLLACNLHRLIRKIDLILLHSLYRPNVTNVHTLRGDVEEAPFHRGLENHRLCALGS